MISQFTELDDRNDTGSLFENFIVMERLKSNSSLQRITQTYFWRTYDGQEIDLVEEKNGVLRGYEVKWSEKKKIKIPKFWKESYPEAGWAVFFPLPFLYENSTLVEAGPAL